MNDDDDVSLEASLAGGMKANKFEFPNPGAVFDDIDEAARHTLKLINPVSIARNLEYDWQFYQDPHTKKFGYSDPIENGLRGGKVHFLPLAPGMQDQGMAHTHGDYSKASGVRTDQNGDEFDSDHFSGYTPPGQPPNTDPNLDMGAMQLQTMQALQAGHPTWTYYVATPSGGFLKWQHGGRVQDFK